MNVSKEQLRLFEGNVGARDFGLDKDAVREFGQQMMRYFHHNNGKSMFVEVTKVRGITPISDDLQHRKVSGFLSKVTTRVVADVNNDVIELPTLFVKSHPFDEQPFDISADDIVSVNTYSAHYGEARNTLIQHRMRGTKAPHDADLQLLIQDSIPEFVIPGPVALH